MNVEFINSWKEDKVIAILPVIAIDFNSNEVMFIWIVWGMVIEL